MTYHRFLVILLWIIKGVTIGLALFSLFWILKEYYGKLTIVYDFSKDSKYISHLAPWQRLMPIEELNGDWLQQIKDDLVYFDVKSPPLFQKVTCELTFDNPSQTIFKLGRQVDAKDNYLEKPIKNKFIDNLVWFKIQEGGVILLQKQKKYNSLKEFLNNPPKEEKIGTYFYKLPCKNNNCFNLDNQTQVNLDIDNLDYIITEYISPINNDNWSIQTISFEDIILYRNKAKDIRFRLNAQGLRESGKTIAISNIKIEFKKPIISFQNLPLLTKLFIKKIQNVKKFYF